MHRKKFLSSVIATTLILPNIGRSQSRDDENRKAIIPPYLNPGDQVGITSPAGYITLKEIEPAMQQIQDWGFTCRVGETIGKRDFGFAGTDEERATDFQRMLDDPSIKAIMCGRGGYGLVRIIDKLDFSRFAERPKWIIGFSDITVLHSHLNRNYNIASIHSKMCNSFPDNWELAEEERKETIRSIEKCLKGEKMYYTAPSNLMNKPGKAEGMLVGGNLKTIESLSASVSDIQTRDKILFVEDTGEYLYSIDRMFWNLKRAGKLSKLKGLIIGGFKIKADNPGEEFGKDIFAIVFEKVKEYDYPVCFDFPVGHQVNNYALKCGIIHSLEVNGGGSTLHEI